MDMRACNLTIVAVLASCGLLHLTCTRTADAQGNAAERPAPSFPQCGSVRVALSDDQWRIVAARYSQMMTLFSPRAGGKDLSRENERVKWVKLLNPQLTVLVYGSAINASNFRLPAWRRPTEHPEWFLKDEAGEWLSDWEYQSALHLDPANVEWQQYVGRTLKDYIARYGYDGVFLDLVTATTYYVNFKKPHPAVDPKTGKAYADADWKAANMKLLRAVRDAIGQDKILLINGGHRGRRFFETGYLDFLEVADGLCHEGFCGWALDPFQDKFGPVEDWKADVDILAECAKRGKIVWAVGNCRARKPDESTE
ncbi:MAG: hypothetical protein FJ279_02700, partial [Planctomycetes bacterium]|nr:hypothetical protein [Planctomycetota bacterium]